MGMFVVGFSLFWAIRTSDFLDRKFLPTISVDVGDIIAHIDPNINMLIEHTDKLRVVDKTKRYYKCVKLTGPYQYKYVILSKRAVRSEYYKYIDWDDDIITEANV
jgi:hypothetical protein